MYETNTSLLMPSPLYVFLPAQTVARTHGRASMDLNLQGKVALVTGGSKGIGRQVALTFAKEGARVAICARTPDDLQRAKTSILEAVPTSDVCTISTDLRHEAGAHKAIQGAIEYFGAVDILVNCAGAAPGRFLADIDDETWHEALALKFLGYV